MDLSAAIAVLMGADRQVVLQALQKDAGSLYQAVFQAGHDVGYGKKAGELTTAQARVTELEGKLTQAATDLAEARKDKPDLAAVHKQYQDAAAEAERKHQETVTGLNRLLDGGAIDSTVRGLRDRLVARGVDPDKAQVLTEKAEVRARLKVAGDRSVTILQTGKEIPIAASGDLTPLDVLADELFKTVDAKFIVAKTDTGSGDRSGGAQTGTELYARIRKETAEQGTAQATHLEKARAAIGLT